MDNTLSPKVEALYKAIDSLMTEGQDVNSMTVSQIAARAGIGKGTTYEYFTNKEEMIGGAIVYKISTICREVVKEMAKRTSVREMINYIFDAIEMKEYEKAALLKVVNIVTDTSPLSRQIEKIIAEHMDDTYMPERILNDILKQAEKEGYRADNKPVSYVKLNVAAKFLAYLVFSMIPAYKEECLSDNMRRLVCEGIIKEFESETEV